MKTKEELLEELEALDAAHAVAVAACQAQITIADAGRATAGSEYDGTIAEAEDDTEEGIAAYQTILTETQTSLTAAQTAVDAIDETVPTIGSISDITITTGGTPDCSAASIQSAVNAALQEIRDAFADVLDALTNGNTTQVKTALQKLKDTGQTFRSNMPPAEDSEAEKASTQAVLDAMF